MIGILVILRLAWRIRNRKPTPMWFWRELICGLREADPDMRMVFDWLFGPALCQRVMDIERRRRMTLWSLKATETTEAL